MKGLFLLSLIIPIIAQGKEVFTNEQGLKIEYVSHLFHVSMIKKPTKVI